MIAQFLVRRIATQIIEYAIRVSIVDPEAMGPFNAGSPVPTVAPTVEPGCEAIPYEGVVTLTPPTATAVLRSAWPGGQAEPFWVEEGELRRLVASAVSQCYRDIDAVYADAIGNRAVEYTDAEADARAFLAGGAATENVSSFAVSNPTGTAQTNQWAAEQIVARADAFKAAQVAMRAQRFDSQAAMRACSTPAGLAHVVYLWGQFIVGLRAQLGLA